MRIDVVTVFPGMFAGPTTESIVGRARASGRLELGFANPRDFTPGRRGSVDDRPFGGGPGMVLKAGPLRSAIRSVRRRGSRVILLCAQGKPFTAAAARRLADLKSLVLVCGHYEGIDERASGLCDEALSIGDYVLTGGELPAMVVIDAVTRFLPGVLKKREAVLEAESFEGPTLDHPQYTRPRVWRGRRVPAALLSGDHARIGAWRRRAALAATKAKRPDLLVMGDTTKVVSPR